MNSDGGPTTNVFLKLLTMAQTICESPPYILRRYSSVVLKGISFKTDRYKYKPFLRAGTAIPVLCRSGNFPCFKGSNQGFLGFEESRIGVDVEFYWPLKFPVYGV